MQDNPEIVICVPGPWLTPTHLEESLAKGDHRLSGDHLVSPTGQDFTLELEGADSRMTAAFAAAGYRRMAEEDLVLIGTHRLVAYIIGHGGSLQSVQFLARAATALVLAGGMGVKIESGGIAYPARKWSEQTHSGISILLQRAFVAYVHEAGEVWSCGMKAFGLPDAAFASSSSPHDGAELVRIFAEYLVAESPVILTGQTFSPSPDEPSYLLRHERCERYPADDLFHNPFGYWRLIPASQL